MFCWERERGDKAKSYSSEGEVRKTCERGIFTNVLACLGRERGGSRVEKGEEMEGVRTT